MMAKVMLQRGSKGKIGRWLDSEGLDREEKKKESVSTITRGMMAKEMMHSGSKGKTEVIWCDNCHEDLAAHRCCCCPMTLCEECTFGCSWRWCQGQFCYWHHTAQVHHFWCQGQ